MPEIRYVHAADLHLDSSFAGISRENASPDLAKRLQESTFTALERLVRLCEGQRPDFLVLAGDIYNREDASIKAQIKLREACQRLNDLEIPVYIAHGNHDPFPSRFQSLKFPANVHIFSSGEPEIFEFQGRDNKRALIHGLSHAKDDQSRNLACLFKRRVNDPAFQLAVLHCSVENAGQSDSLAPCTLSDLKNAAMDAWALGHAHNSVILSEQPFIAYPGNVQALNINETGKRGCLLVHARQTDNGWHCFSEFHSLGSVCCQKLYLDLDRVTEQDELEKRLEKLIEEELAHVDPTTSAIILRLHVSGRTVLNSGLRKEAGLEELRSIIAAHSSQRVTLALKDVILETRDEESWDESMAREDLLGETMRLYADLVKNPEIFKEICNQAFAPLLKSRHHADILSRAKDAELLELLYQAENLCMDILENR